MTNRRAFFSRILGVPAAVCAWPLLVEPHPRPASPAPTPVPVRVRRADGRTLILGVAMESVCVGDLVQIVTEGHLQTVTEGHR